MTEPSRRKQSEEALQQSTRDEHAPPSATHVERHVGPPLPAHAAFAPAQHWLTSAQAAPAARHGPGAPWHRWLDPGGSALQDIGPAQH
jgi:hypothetical protein